MGEHGAVSGAEERLGDDPTSELWGEHRSRYRFAGQFARGQRVLDLACGAGFGLRMLMDAGAWPLGIDADAATLVDLHSRAPSARLARADATCLPLRASSFDLVTSFETIEHVADARALVHEVRRVLRPGGHLVLSTPNRRFGPPERHTGNPFHIREFTADELAELLGEAFEDVQMYGQRPAAGYRYVPFLMLRPDRHPRSLLWKLQARLPFALKDGLADALSGRTFYPGEDDYCFELGECDGAHALLAVAR